ncbi:sensor domain-containing protein [Cognatilysobacter segetis]|uniref:sensor domain-containing protein n=1 Tax=Cognatilysobacter segetis TaxID=2492394 RepID=UPI0013900C7D|nr:GGDEF domain-containing phosphodiesterase [Lysobacter segetis]
MAGDFDAFDASPVPMLVYDTETLRILEANPAAAALYGWPGEAMRRLTVLDLRPEADRERLLAHLRRPPAERAAATTWVHRHRDGTPMHVEVRAVDIVHDGRPARLVVVRDVSESERANERVHLIAQAMSDAAYDWDVPTGGLWFSDGFCENFGFAPEAVPTTLEQWSSLVHPDERVRVHASLAAAIEGDASHWVEEYCFQRGDGTYTEVLDRGYLQRDGHGTAVRMVGGMIDRRPQRLLSTRLRLLERAVEASASGILIADASDPAFPIVYANPAFEQITGYAPREVEGRAFDFLPALDPETAGAGLVREALASMSDTQASLQGTRRDGAAFWYDFSVTPMRDADGRVTHLLGLVTDTSERQRHAQQLQWRATHDGLTGLPNRHHVLERVAEAVQRAQADGRRVSVLIVDLDEFKLVNDELGHAAGDRMLCEIGLRLHRALGARALIGRSVGDEFVIVLEGDDELQAERAAGTVHAVLAEPIDGGGVRPCKLTACVGYSHVPEDAASAESLLMSAELATFQAKKQGRNCTVAYRAGRTPSSHGKLQLLQELREALERREFRLLFQPVFSADLRLVALEALVRWEHPQRGLLPPSEFITICEESGLIVELGRRVLHEAARHHAFLVAQGQGHVRISVNVSAMQFAHGLLDDVRRVIEEFRLPRGALELELTESVIVDDPARAAQVMAALAELGVTLAIDDFGVGYSSLSYLKRLPIHRLKIDRSFVNDLESDASDRSICEAVIALARTLRLGVVAEGVESTFQRDWLRRSGAGELQGYLFARPLPFETATHVEPVAAA